MICNRSRNIVDDLDRVCIVSYSASDVGCVGLPSHLLHLLKNERMREISLRPPPLVGNICDRTVIQYSRSLSVICYETILGGHLK